MCSKISTFVSLKLTSSCSARFLSLNAYRSFPSVEVEGDRESDRGLKEEDGNTELRVGGVSCARVRNVDDKLRVGVEGVEQLLASEHVSPYLPQRRLWASERVPSSCSNIIAISTCVSGSK
jgi:hypothetical protein